MYNAYGSLLAEIPGMTVRFHAGDWNRNNPEKMWKSFPGVYRGHTVCFLNLL